MANVTLSKRWTLQISDAWRTAFMAIISPVLVYLYDWASDDHDLNWHLVFKMAIASGITYLLKNWAVEPPKVTTTTNTNVKAENAANKIKTAVS